MSEPPKYRDGFVNQPLPPGDLLMKYAEESGFGRQRFQIRSDVRCRWDSDWWLWVAVFVIVCNLGAIGCMLAACWVMTH